MMQKVFIPNLPMRYDQVTNKKIPSIDLNPASHYGELIPLIEGKIDSYQLGFAEISSRIKAEMKAGDFILSVGDVLLVAAAILYANESFGSVNVLRWDRQMHKYFIVEAKL
jgi:hypothetical protein